MACAMAESGGACSNITHSSLGSLDLHVTIVSDLANMCQSVVLWLVVSGVHLAKYVRTRSEARSSA